ncbi:pol protein [Cucumis melo var. makuwa]|uniref:Pol protein n=1 Tax=Cucumis melo var. makuwa TaxID=1194695 RepID=A0A5D3BZE1_CUCMM|nr:pol protein [Cucumis melo var. makuwa]
MLGPELVQTTNAAIQKIRARMLIAQSRQKSYADVRRKDLEFEVGDMVFLKVAPMKGVLRFEKKGKLSPRFVGPFEILERIGPVAYHLALPPSLSAVHDVFHVSKLSPRFVNRMHVVDFEPLRISENLSYEEQPVEILAREVKKLRSREISLVKVLWRNHGVEEATWKREEDMRAQYPELPATRRALQPSPSRIGSRPALSNRRLRGSEVDPRLASRTPPPASHRRALQKLSCRSRRPIPGIATRAPVSIIACGRPEPPLSTPNRTHVAPLSLAEPHARVSRAFCLSQADTFFKLCRSLLAKPSRQALSSQLNFGPFHKCQWNTLDQLTWSVGFLQQWLKRRNLDLGTSPLGKHIFWSLRLVKKISRVVPAWVSFGITTYLGLRSPTGHHSSMDIDMIRVIQQDPRSPIVLVLPSISLQTKAEVGARASWRAIRSDRGEP